MAPRHESEFRLQDPIDVPAEAFAPKPIFPDFPSPEIVAEVREWVKTQPPWAWRGHTHVKPDENEALEIRYVAVRRADESLADVPVWVKNARQVAAELTSMERES
jgi:hypothetical protein